MNNKTKNKKKSIAVFKVISSMVLGFVNGFIGAGAGMLCVPILNKLFKLEKRKSHATSLMIIFPLSLVSGFVYLQKNDMPLKNIFFAGLGLFLGGILGGFIFKKIPEKILKIIFAILMFLAGIMMVV